MLKLYGTVAITNYSITMQLGNCNILLNSNNKADFNDCNKFGNIQLGSNSSPYRLLLVKLFHLFSVSGTRTVIYSTQLMSKTFWYCKIQIRA